MVKQTIKFLLLLTVLTVSAFAQTDWTGEYFYAEDGGETAGGSKIYIAHTITVTEKDGKLEAHIYSQGFQTSRDIFADAKIEENSIRLYFREKGPDHVMGDFQSGALLLILEDIDERIRTNWGEFKPVLDKNLTNGLVRFEESVEEPDEPEGWARIAFNRSRFSAYMPVALQEYEITDSFEVYFERRNKTINISNAEFGSGAIRDTVIRFEVYHSKAPREIAESLRQNNWDGKIETQTAKFGCLDGYRLVKSSSTYYLESWQIIGLDSLVVLTVVNQTGSNVDTNRFLNSLKIVPPTSGADCEVDTAAITARKTLQFVPLPLLEGNAGVENQALFLITKSRPGYTKKARNKSIHGVVLIEAKFSRAGIAKTLEVKKTLPHGLEDQAKIAIMQMLFLPEIRNGKRISVIKRIAFNFSIY